MVAIYLEKTVHEGLWARRMALFFLQLLILTVLLHRFGSLATPAAMNLLTVSIGGLVLAIVVALVGIVRIWFGGQIGAGQAFAGIAIALIGLALPLYYLSQFFLLPRLNDVETTPRQPMQFSQLAAQRPADANRIVEPDLAAAEIQEKAYPDLRPMELERSATETFDIVHEAVKRIGWTIVLNEPPGEQPGRIEATDRTMIMGYTDDVLVRVTGDDTHAFIDCPLGVALRHARSRRQRRPHPCPLCRGEGGVGEGREDRARAGRAEAKGRHCACAQEAGEEAPAETE